MTALWIHEAAARFWADAGGAPAALPRDLREAAAWALPVHIVDLAGLGVARVNGWLDERGIEARLAMPDRPLRACTVVYDGSGLLFVDAADDAPEQQFSLAHEIAHYLVEYAGPRARALARLGPGVLHELDGRRDPSTDERIGAVLGGVALGVALHLMERTADGHPAGADISVAERRADALAFELLAPVDLVRARLPANADRPAVTAMLGEPFGLPPAPAAAYARALCPEPPAGSLFRRLFSAS